MISSDQQTDKQFAFLEKDTFSISPSLFTIYTHVVYSKIAMKTQL